MGAETAKPEKAAAAKQKPHEVFVGGELKFDTNKKGDALTEAYKLQETSNETIEIVHHETKKVTRFSKGRYEKNWRITTGDYSKYEKVQQDQPV